MEDRIDLRAYYDQQIQQVNEEYQKLKQKISRIGILRLLLVLGIILLFVWGGLKNPIALGGVVILVLIFLFLLKKHDALFVRRKYCEKKVEILKNELKGIHRDYSNFDNGQEFVDSAHSYSLDLDLFGDHSIFQSVNRTTNRRSKLNLRDKFLHPYTQKDQILEMQNSMRELSSSPDFLFDFLTKGDSKDKDFDIVAYMTNFLKDPIFSSVFWRFSFLVPLFIIAFLVVLNVVFGFTSSIYIVGYCVLFLVGMIPMGIINNKMKKFDQMVESVKSYVVLLKTVEERNFESEGLKKIKQTLVDDRLKATVAIKKLENLSQQLTLSHTLLGVLVLNPFVLWNVIYTLKLQNWFKHHKTDVENWIEGVSSIDALVSLGLFCFNHPNTVYPEVSGKECVEGTDLSHPMMDPKVCVANDIMIGDTPHFLIVTGANMAGKSTFLRTVSLNLLLAEMGLPVFAKSFCFFPFQLITNLRTSDSLANNESYFFSELKKLKHIIDELESGKKMFIVLDEILKGTNSEDKQKGSMALMKQLLENNGYGIIATHDLILGNLQNEYPKQVKNYRFEGEITNNELYFSYKIKEGVAQNMNACFLMKKMGIKGL